MPLSDINVEILNIDELGLIALHNKPAAITPGRHQIR
jgi:hypothetical protein